MKFSVRSIMPHCQVQVLDHHRANGRNDSKKVLLRLYRLYEHTQEVHKSKMSDVFTASVGTPFKFSLHSFWRLWLLLHDDDGLQNLLHNTIFLQYTPFSGNTSTNKYKKDQFWRSTLQTRERPSTPTHSYDIHKVHNVSMADMRVHSSNVIQLF